MVIVVATRAGFFELESLIRSGKYPIWIGAGVLLSKEINALLASHISLTILRYAIEDQDSLMDALQSIDEHHPKQRVWCEIQHEI